MARRKQLKSRDNIYLVTRYLADAQEAPLGAFRTLEGADMAAEAWHQEFVDNGFDPDSVKFVISIVSFYED